MVPVLCPSESPASPVVTAWLQRLVGCPGRGVILSEEESAAHSALGFPRGADPGSCPSSPFFHQLWVTERSLL